MGLFKYFKSLFVREAVVDYKKLVIAAVAVFFVYEFVDFTVHSLILAPTYMKMQNIWRADMMQKMWIMYITALVFSFTFVYIFAKGYEGKGIIEGVRFGAIISLLMLLPGIFNQYVIYPVSYKLALTWFVFGVAQFVICGIVASLIYKPKKA
ncbi:hypothetical protein ACFL58_00300 [Elusimicrobiota bacterium]